LAISITQVASKFVTGHLLLVLLPIILFVVMIVFVLLWIALAVAFYSLGNPIHDPKSLPFTHFALTTPLTVLVVVHAVYLVWMLIFFVETSEFLIIGTATNWYFELDNAYADSSSRYFKYHGGSVLLGSFLWLIIGWLKLIFNLITVINLFYLARYR
jgi:hypothetical protein